MTNITYRRVAGRVVFSPKEIYMVLPIVLISIAALTLTALYAVFGVAVVRRLRKPTCRVCLFRQSCPNRELEYAEPKRKQCWSCGQTVQCAAPTQDAKL